MSLKAGLGNRQSDCSLLHSIYIQLLKVRGFLPGLASLIGVQNTIPIKMPLEARKLYSYPVSRCGFFHSCPFKCLSSWTQEWGCEMLSVSRIWDGGILWALAHDLRKFIYSEKLIVTYPSNNYSFLIWESFVRQESCFSDSLLSFMGIKCTTGQSIMWVASFYTTNETNMRY